MFCEKCGAEMSLNDKFCWRCGNSIVYDQEENSDEEKVCYKERDKEEGDCTGNVESVEESKDVKEFQFLSSIGMHFWLLNYLRPLSQKAIIGSGSLRVNIEDKEEKIIPISEISKVVLSSYFPVQTLVILLICLWAILADLSYRTPLQGCIIMVLIMCFVFITMRNERVRIIEKSDVKIDLIVRKAEQQNVEMFVKALKNDPIFKGDVEKAKDKVQIILYSVIAFLFLGVLLSGMGKENLKDNKTGKLEDLEDMTATDKEDMEGDSGYYLNDSIQSDDWSISVGYATTEEIIIGRAIYVNCTITNTSSMSARFCASDYFSLNNAGVIKEAEMNDYDYTEIAPNTTFTTDIEFYYPDSANMDLSNMTLMIKDIAVNLCNKL